MRSDCPTSTSYWTQQLLQAIAYLCYPQTLSQAGLGGRVALSFDFRALNFLPTLSLALPPLFSCFLKFALIVPPLLCRLLGFLGGYVVGPHVMFIFLVIARKRAPSWTLSARLPMGVTAVLRSQSLAVAYGPRQLTTKVVTHKGGVPTPKGAPMGWHSVEANGLPMGRHSY